MIRILIDPVACDAYGYCAELLPEAITLDEWGYPIVDGKPLPPELVDAAQACRPRLPPARHHAAGAQGRSLRRAGGATMAGVPERPAVTPDRPGDPAGAPRATSAASSSCCCSAPVPGGPPSTEDPADLGPYRAALRDIEAAGGAVLVAELDGEVVGVCQLIVFRHLQAQRRAAAPRSSRCTCTPTTGGRESARALLARRRRPGPRARLLPRPADLQHGPPRRPSLLRAARVRRPPTSASRCASTLTAGPPLALCRCNHVIS